MSALVTTRTWPPKYLSPVAPADLARSRGDNVIEFGETMCRIVKDSVAGRRGELIEFRPWQRDLTRHLLAVGEDGRLKHRSALIGLPRKNGKSAWLSVIVLDHILFGPAGGEAYSCAADREQAKIVFGTVREMVGMDPELSDLLTVTRDAIYNSANGSVYKALSAEAFTKEGLSPTLVAFDELHAQPNRELYDVMSLAQGARIEPQLIAITTAGVKYDSSGRDSVCYQQYQYGKRVASGEVEDDTFCFAWWEGEDGADHTEPTTWADANPGYDDLVAEADFHSAVRRTPEAEFRTKRLNQWVSSHTAWFPAGVWDAAADTDKTIEPGRRVVLAFDGSLSGDTTGFTIHDVETGHITVGGNWEKPSESLDWTVPRAEVKDAIRKACTTWECVEIAWDTFLWLDAAEELADEGLPVVKFDQRSTVMGPATQRLFEDISDRNVTHDGDPRLARHVGNAQLKTDARGSRLAKDHRNSNRKIDLAVCAVMGHERATWHKGRPVLTDDELLRTFY